MSFHSFDERTIPEMVLKYLMTKSRKTAFFGFVLFSIQTFLGQNQGSAILRFGEEKNQTTWPIFEVFFLIL